MVGLYLFKRKNNKYFKNNLLGEGGTMILDEESTDFLFFIFSKYINNNIIGYTVCGGYI